MSLVQTITRQVVRLVVKPQLNPKVSVPTQRKRLDLLRLMPMPRGIKESETHLNGIPTRRLTPALSNGGILYLHGGAYCIGSPDSHREMVARISRMTEREAFIVDYRLAPENPYPAALDDAMDAYLGLLEEHQNVVIMGDSAGGGLTMALMQKISRTELAQPHALVLFSPWCDLTTSGLTMEANRHIDPMLTPAWLKNSASLYAGDIDYSDPGLSPLFGSMKDFPRTLIQVGSDEILLSDSQRAFKAMQEANIDVELQVYEGMWHVFQIHMSFLKKSKDALLSINNFLRDQ